MSWSTRYRDQRSSCRQMEKMYRWKSRKTKPEHLFSLVYIVKCADARLAAQRLGRPSSLDHGCIHAPPMTKLCAIKSDSLVR